MLIILQAFQVLSEYLQILDSYSELSAVQEMSRGVEVMIIFYFCMFIFIVAYVSLGLSINELHFPLYLKIKC